jgi:pimeloyl-ACP methyl ester carboxylesterase
VLALTDRGQGACLVLIHGIGSSRRRWDPIVDRLDGFRCVALDLPGHGESAAVGMDLISAAGAVQDVIASQSLEPVAVVGHSLGANVALLHAALHHPASVVAIEPVPLHLPSLSDSLQPYVPRFRSDDFEAAFLEWEATKGVAPFSGGLAPRQEVVLSYWSRLLRREDAEQTQPQWEAALGAVSVPALVLLGDAPDGEDQAILDRMPTAQVEVTPGLGHFLHLVDPEGFCNRLREWVSSVD